MDEEANRRRCQAHLLPRWKHIKARDIAAADVLAVFDSLRERPVLANRVLALVSRIFTFAIGRQWRPDNPAGRIKKHPEPGRDRVLSEDESVRPSVRQVLSPCAVSRSLKPAAPTPM